MQYVNTCPVLNVEESDRLSFMPYLFGTDFYARRIAGVCAGETMDA